MPGGRIRVLAAIALVLLACAASRVARAADELEPYRALARSAAATRLLAAARAAMTGHWRPAAAPASSQPAAAGADSAIAWPGRPAALYVSLARGRATRACVGRPENGAPDLSAAVRALALEALDADPRHPPVREEEMAGLRIVIAFAGEGEAIADPMLADPGREGLLVSSPRGSVAFLPGEARTVRWALREAGRVGVLQSGAADASYRRFPVITIAEPEPRVAPAKDDDATP
jgi:AMMECR1 domain-containing protein